MLPSGVSKSVLLALAIPLLGGCGASSFDEKFEESQRELDSEMSDQESELEAQLDQEVGTPPEQE